MGARASGLFESVISETAQQKVLSHVCVACIDATYPAVIRYEALRPRFAIYMEHIESGFEVMIRCAHHGSSLRPSTPLPLLPETDRFKHGIGLARA